jgi:hypothetical protein
LHELHIADAIARSQTVGLRDLCIREVDADDASLLADERARAERVGAGPGPEIEDASPGWSAARSRW